MRQRLRDLVRPQDVDALAHELLAVERSRAHVQVVHGVVAEGVQRSLQVLALHRIDVTLHGVIGLSHGDPLRCVW